jgi:hypothetical protein
MSGQGRPRQAGIVPQSGLGMFGFSVTNKATGLPVEPEAKKAKDDGLECDDCGKTFTTKGPMEVHLRLKHGRVGGGFSSHLVCVAASELVRHLATLMEVIRDEDRARHNSHDLKSPSDDEVEEPDVLVADEAGDENDSSEGRVRGDVIEPEEDELNSAEAAQLFEAPQLNAEAEFVKICTCGEELEDLFVFCPHCGAKFVDVMPIVVASAHQEKFMTEQEQVPSSKQFLGKIKVSNIPTSANEADLAEVFDFGDPFIWIARNRKQRSRGYGYVEFLCKEDYETALKLNVILSGKTLKTKPKTDTKRKGANSRYARSIDVKIGVLRALDEAKKTLAEKADIDQAKVLQKHCVAVVSIATGIPKGTIKTWIRGRAVIEANYPKKKKFKTVGSGRKPLFPEAEKKIRLFVEERTAKNLISSRVLVVKEFKKYASEENAKVARTCKFGRRMIRAMFRRQHLSKCLAASARPMTVEQAIPLVRRNLLYFRSILNDSRAIKMDPIEGRVLVKNRYNIDQVPCNWSVTRFETVTIKGTRNKQVRTTKGHSKRFFTFVPFVSPLKLIAIGIIHKGTGKRISAKEWMFYKKECPNLAFFFSEKCLGR